MTTITNPPPLTAYSYTPPAANTGPASVASTLDPSLAQTAVTISAAGNIVATLMANPNAAPTYDAVNLLNALAQAGTPSSSSSAQASTNSGSATTQQAAATSSSSASSGLYTASGGLQATPSTDLTSNWASILKTNPELTAVAAGDAMNQGIVGSLSSSS